MESLLSPEDSDQKKDIETAPYSWDLIKEQLCNLLSMTWPISFSYLLQMSLSLAAVFSLGHVGTKELAASALATMFANVSGYSIGLGMATALDTLCSQAHTGSQDPHALGKHTRRGFLIMAILCVPICIVWSFTKDILVYLGQDMELATMANDFMTCLMPSLLPYFISECLKKFLQAQGIMSAHLHIVMLVSPLNMLMQYLLVWNNATRVGFLGAAIATTITYTLMMCFMFAYVKFIDGGKAWGEWKLVDLFNWNQITAFLKLGLPGIAMLCSEWWAFEVVALAAGLLGDKILAAQTIVLNTCALTYMVALGISVATSTIIGNSLGALKPNMAKLVAHCSLGLGFTAACINCMFLVLVKDSWAALWTADEDVIVIVASLVPLVTVFQMSDSMGAVLGGVLRGLGAQKHGAYINLISFYIVGLPLGLLLTFPPGELGWSSLGLFGLWIGLSIASFMNGIIQIILIQSMDWEEKALESRRRVADDGYAPVIDGEESIV